MSPKQAVYLVLALMGLVATWYFNIQFMMAGSSLGFIEASMVNNAAASMSVDVMIAAAAGVFWILVESKRIGMKHAWVFIPLTVLSRSHSLSRYIFFCGKGCGSRIRRQAAIGSWTSPWQCETQRTWSSSALCTGCCPAAMRSGVLPARDAWLRDPL